LRVYGAPWWAGHSWDYKTFKNYERKNQPDAAGFGKIPSNVDLLLTHGPPRGVLDEADGHKGNHSGSRELWGAIVKNTPKVHLFGHVHEQRGSARVGTISRKSTLFVNSSMTDRWKEPKQLQSAEGSGSWNGAHLIIATKEQQEQQQQQQEEDNKKINKAPQAAEGKGEPDAAAAPAAAAAQWKFQAVSEASEAPPASSSSSSSAPTSTREAKRVPRRILHMSDTHNLLTERIIREELPEADILIHTGDFTERGTMKECEEFNRLLSGPLKDKYPVRIVIAGNHDLYNVGTEYGKIKQALPGATHFLIHEQVEVDGLRIYGAPWWPGHRWDYRTRSKHPDPAGFERIPMGTDLLLTHGPARGALDEADGVSGNHSGSVKLAEEIKKRRPKVHLFGHIHEQRGSTRMGTGGSSSTSTLVVNSAMTDRWIKPKQLQSGTRRNAGRWHGAHLLLASPSADGWKFSTE